MAPSTGDGRILVENLFMEQGSSFWNSLVTVIEADGHPVRGDGQWAPDFYVWALSHDWLFGHLQADFTGGLVGVSLYRSEDPFPTGPFDEPVTDVSVPFVLQPFPSGGVLAITSDADPQKSFCQSNGPDDYTVQMSARRIDLDAGVTAATRFACLGIKQAIVAAANSRGEGLIYFPANHFQGAQLWRLSPATVATLVHVPLDEEVKQIVALTDGRFALASASRWLGAIGSDDTWQPTPCWLVPRLGQDLRPLPSGSGYWHATYQPVPGFPYPELETPCMTRLEELAADGTSCHTYDIGSVAPGQCNSRPMMRGVDGTVTQLSSTCDVLAWPRARP